MLTHQLKIYFILFSTIFISCKEQKEEPAEIVEKSPNIIYILTDDLGYGDIAAFNTKGKIPTPHIDKLAANGMKFTDAHTSSAVCTPTRYGILTGRYNWRSPLKSGVLTGKSKALIPTERSTVASVLKKADYHTAFIGKWHLGWDWAVKDSTLIEGEGWDASDFDNLDFTKPITNGPQDLGFDYSYGHSGSLDMAPYVYVENGKVTAAVDTITVDKGKYTWWREGPTAADFVHDDVTPNFFRKAIDYVEDRSKEDKSFFLYLALPSPHTPILPIKEWLGKSDLNPYADFVMMVDDYVGQLVSTIEKEGLAENTIVIFTSDNGCSPQANFELLAEKKHHPSGGYRGHKADIYEGGHRVPFIVKWPREIEASSVSDKTICTTDFMATAADIAGIRLNDNEGEDSFSMLPLFLNRGETEYLREATVHHSINGSFAIRKDEFKLILCPGSGGWSTPKPNSEGIEKLSPVQLYDLSADPEEKQNLYAQHPEKVEELKSLLVSYVDNGRSTPGKKQENSDLNLQGKTWQQREVVLSK
ncbi:arylsulfatase A-like enzyme [Flavobacteriaceae bacterium MAR_2009_75]|nr:arylsulfatase A-like enzyme [Flavobacteriaceae bacterium MAR_2009_75]